MSIKLFFILFFISFFVNAAYEPTTTISNTVKVEIVSGTVSVNTTGLATDANQLSVTANAGASSSKALTVQGAAGMTPFLTDGSGHTQPVSGSVSILNFPATQAVTGTFYQATQPVSLVSIPINAAASTSALQTTGNSSLSSIDTKLNSQSTAANQATANGLLTSIEASTSDLGLSLGGDGGALPTYFQGIGGSDGSSFRALKTNSSGQLQVGIVGTVPISGSITATNPSVGTTGAAVPGSATFVGGSDGTNLKAIKVSSTGVVSVDGSATTQPVSISGIVSTSGTSTININSGQSVTANIGTTNGLALDSSLTTLNAKDFATQTTLALIKAKTDNIDVALSTRTKPADVQVVSGTATVNVNSGQTIGLAAGAAVIGHVINDASSAVIGHVINDSGSTTAVTGTVTTSGTATVNINSGQNVGLSAGSNLIGKVSIDQTTPGTTNLVALGANQSVNVAQFNGVAPLMGNGVSGTGVQRVAIISDNTPFHVIHDSGSTTAITGTVTTSGTSTVNINSGQQITANAGTNLNTSALALSATQTDGTQKSIARGGAKGTTTAADITSTASGANHQLIDIGIYDGSGNQITSFGGSGTQYADGAAKGTSTGTLMMVDDGTNIQSAAGTTGGVLKVDLSATTANSTAIKTDGSAVTQPVSIASIVSTSGTSTVNINSGQVVGLAAGAQVIGHVINDAGSAVIGHVINDSGSTTVVTGTVTTSGTSTVNINAGQSITANAGTNLNTSALALDSTVAKDSSLSTINTSVNGLLKPASTLAAVTSITNAVTVTQGTGTNLHAVIDSGSVTTSGTATVNINSGQSVGLAAGTNGIGKLTANSGVTIGAVEIAAAQTIATTNAGTFAVQNTEVRPSSASTSNVSSSATNVTLLSSNASRRGASFYNDSTQVAYLKYGVTASATSYTVQIPAGGYFELHFPAYTGQIDCIWASANGSMRVTEF